MLKEYNLYYNNGNDSFLLESIDEFKRIVKLELKTTVGNIETIEELEKEIETLNEKFKNKKISFFLINKEDDEKSSWNYWKQGIIIPRKERNKKKQGDDKNGI